LPSRHIFLVHYSDPQSYGEAAGNPFWEYAMQEEYNSLLENQNWDLVPLPSGRKIVRCRWVYRTKSIVDRQSADTNPGLSPKEFSRFMVLTMMRPSLQ
jgi:hypothetical protein